MNKNGFTLVEVIVSMAILSILLLISIPTFKGMSMRLSLENETKEIYALAQRARASAFAEKVNYTLRFTGDKFEVVRGGAVVWDLDLENTFSVNGGGTIVTGSNGIITPANSFILATHTENPEYDCVTFLSTRIHLGEIDAGACNAK